MAKTHTHFLQSENPFLISSFNLRFDPHVWQFWHDLCSCAFHFIVNHYVVSQLFMGVQMHSLIA